MAKRYTEIGRYQSKSSPGKTYIVNQDENGELSCTCRGWTMKKPGQERTCPHVRDAAAGSRIIADLDEELAAPPAPAPTPATTTGQGGNLAEMLRTVREAKEE